MLTNKWNATNPRQRDHHILDTWPAIMKVCFLVEEAIWKAASLRNLIARVSENRQDRVSNPRPEGDQTSGKRSSPALQVDPPLKINGLTSEQSCLWTLVKIIGITSELWFWLNFVHQHLSNLWTMVLEDELNTIFSSSVLQIRWANHCIVFCQPSKSDRRRCDLTSASRGISFPFHTCF